MRGDQVREYLIKALFAHRQFDLLTVDMYRVLSRLRPEYVDQLCSEKAPDIDKVLHGFLAAAVAAGLTDLAAQIVDRWHFEQSSFG